MHAEYIELPCVNGRDLVLINLDFAMAMPTANIENRTIVYYPGDRQPKTIDMPYEDFKREVKFYRSIHGTARPQGK